MKSWSPIVWVFLFVCGAYIFLSMGMGEYIRYDKYQIYLGWWRATIAVLVIVASLRILASRCCQLNVATFLPMNVFLVLFLVLVMPGVLLTADFSRAGATAFYGYLGSFLVFSISAWCVSYWMSFNVRDEVTAFYSRPFQIYPPGAPTYVLMGGILLAGFVLSVAMTSWQQSVFSVVFEFVATGAMPEAAAGIAEQRQDIYLTSSYMGTASIIASYAMTMLLPLTSMFFILNGRIRKNRLEMMVGVAVAIATFVMLIYSGSRLRGLTFLLFVLVTMSLIKPFVSKSIINWAMGIIGVLVIQTIALGRMTGGAGYIENIVIALNRVAERILLTKGYVTGHVFQYIPDASSFRYGETMLLSLVGHKANQVPFSEEMNEVILGYAGTAGPQSFAEAYANFGLPGMLLAAILLGALVQVVGILILRKCSRNPWSLAVAGFVSLLIGRVGYGDVLTFKSYGLHILIIVWLTTMLAACILSVLYTRSSKLPGVQDAI